MTLLTEPVARPAAGPLPSRRTLLALSIAYAALFVALLLASQAPDDVTTPSRVAARMSRDPEAEAWLTYAGIATAAVLLFLGCALRRVLGARTDHWLSGAAGLGFAALGGSLALFAAADLWLTKAVDTGDASAVRTLTIISVASFPFAMLGLCVALLATGLAARASGVLPTWLAWSCIVLGAVAPVGPGGFAPFVLHPLVLVAIAATARLDPQA